MSSPPDGAPAPFFFAGFSAMAASVVRRRPATLAAFWSAVRTTLAGSMTPAFKSGSKRSLTASKPKSSLPARTRASTTAGSCPALAAICRSGSSLAARPTAPPWGRSPPHPRPPRAARPADDGGVALANDDGGGAPQVFERDVLEFAPAPLGDQPPAGQNCHVLQHRLPPVAEAGGLGGRAAERAAQLVHDQCRERLALDLLGDDHERLAGLRHALEQRQEVAHARDLLLEEEEEGLLELDRHLLGVGDEVGGEVAAVETHALDQLEGGVEPLRLLDRDHAVLTHLVHRFGEELPDGGVAVGGDGADLGDALPLLDRLRLRLQRFDCLLDRRVDAALELHGVEAGGEQAEALAENGAGEDGCGGGPVPGDVGGLLRHLAHHPGAEILELVLEIDLLDHGDPVLGDRGGAPAPLDHDVAPAGPERHPGRVGEQVHTRQDALAGLRMKQHELGWHRSSSPVPRRARIPPPFSTRRLAAKGSPTRQDRRLLRPTIEYESAYYRSGGYYAGPHVLGRLDHSPCRVPCGSQTVVDGEGSTP